MRVRFSHLTVTAALLACAISFSNAQQPEPAAVNPGAQVVPALQASLALVTKGREEAQRAGEVLLASTTSGATSGARSADSDFAFEWCRTAIPNGAAGAPFYPGTEKLLNAWINAITSGEDKNPPLDEINTALEKWQQAHAEILDSLQQAAVLEKSLRAKAARIEKMKPESPEWLYAREEQQQQLLTIRKLLSDAGADLNSAAGMPAPILDADRTPSPFAGPVTPGLPDHVWIHLRRASALIGESIAVQIGLANDRGPNVAADANYSVALSCQGCTAKSSEVTIRQSERFTQTEIKITAATARLSAVSSEHKPPILANAYGCYRAPSVSLAAEQDRSTGPADGQTPIPFRLAFHDATGQRATDGRRKSVAPQLTGVGQRILSQQSVAAVLAKDGSIIVPADECVSDEGVVSPLVGAAKISAGYKAQQVGPLEFRFLYAFPLLDKICIALGVLFGFIANYFVMKQHNIRWIASAISSLIGATIVFAAGYAYVLNAITTPDTWVIALGLATIGGVLGVSAAKLVLPKFGLSAQSAEENPAPSE
jgi:hypothetical protein